MATTRQDLREWFERGVEDGATHMIVVCDTFSYEDYPVYVMPGEDARAKFNEHQNPGKMSSVMEVYNLSQDKEEQLKTSGPGILRF